MADRAELAPGLVVAGRYRIEQLLGKGGMGAVYVVTHVKTDEKLALKVLHTTEMADAMALERFQREARAPARIDSDHVVRVTDADVAKELDGAPFLVMELLKGRDLDHELTELGKLPPEVVIGYLRQLARALDKAHKLGIVHRDLKPENLFLSVRDDGTTHLKVLDFGIAKLTSKGGATSSAKTATGALTGTPFYMAPEQLRGDNASVGGHTDVWAVGIMAHKMLTGEDFWTATTVTQLVGQVVYEPMPTPTARGSTLGEPYDAWFAKCCARKLEERFATLGEAVEALAVALGVPALTHSGTAAVSSRVIASASSPGMHSSADGLARTEVAPAGRRPPRAFIVGTLAFAAVVGGVVVWLATRSPHEEPKPAASQPTISTTSVPVNTTATPTIPASETQSFVATPPVTLTIPSAPTPSGTLPAAPATTHKIPSHPTPSASASNAPQNYLDFQH